MPTSDPCADLAPSSQSVQDQMLLPDVNTEVTSASWSLQDREAVNNTKSADHQFCTHCKCNRHFTLPKGCSIPDYSVLYIGSEGRVLTNLMMTMNKCRFLSYCPETKSARQETLNINRELMKRYYMIERAKDANIVGILAGTLGVSRTQDIITQLKTLVKDAGKKSYTFVVGKLNVAKLANFMEVDVFVLVACPQNTLVDSKDFLKPVVTPFEMEVACNQARQWTGDYVTDFLQLLPGEAQCMIVICFYFFVFCFLQLLLFCCCFLFLFCFGFVFFNCQRTQYNQWMRQKQTVQSKKMGKLSVHKH